MGTSIMLNICVLLVISVIWKPAFADETPSKSSTMLPESITSNVPATTAYDKSLMQSGSIYDVENDKSLPLPLQEILKLLRESERNMIKGKEDIILVLGNTGSGKSAFTHWVAGDSELEAVEVAENDFLIVDKHQRVSNTTIKSHTMFPEVVIDPKTKSVYVDLPGFSDTISSSYDIAKAYFIKAVVSQSRRIKMVFIVNYPSLKRGFYRQDFMELVRHAIELVKDIERYKDSMAIVATKVENQYKTLEEKLKIVLIEDEVIIKGIAEFLIGVKLELQRENLLNTDVRAQELNKKKQAFINAFLEKDGQLHYSKIGLFRKPEKAGQVRQMPILQTQNDRIKEIIQNLIFSTKIDDDFGFTISEKSKNEVHFMIKAINANILEGVYKVSAETSAYFNDRVAKVIDLLNNFDIESTNTIDDDIKKIRSLLQKIQRGHLSVTKLIAEFKLLKSANDLSDKVYSNIGDLGNINVTLNRVSTLFKQARFVQFLEKATNERYDINPTIWVSPFQSIENSLDKSRNDIQKRVTSIENNVDNLIKTSINSTLSKIYNYFAEKDNHVNDLISIHNELNFTYVKLLQVQQSPVNLEPLTYVSKICNGLKNMNLKFTKHSLMNIVNHSKYYDFLMNQVQRVIEHLRQSQRWYAFLISLFDEMSKYEIQKDTSKCLQIIEKISVLDEGKKMKDTTMELFIDKCYLKGQKEYNILFKNMILDKSKIQTLMHLSKITLAHEIDRKCVSSGLVIRGFNIKITEVISPSCTETPEFIHIYALNKVFIDMDIVTDNSPIQLAIIAPTWEIVGERKIVLNGAHGSPHKKTSARDGIGPGRNGDDGKPGLPGGSGGNILGIGKTFINSEKLTVHVNGGDGGPGQSGGSGVQGSDGLSPYIPNENTFGIHSGWKESGFIPILVYPQILGVTSYRVTNYGLWYVYGTNCTDGGNGGIGGKGGIGGNPGVVNIVPLQQKPNFKINKEPGKNGADGAAGKSAYPGHPGELLIVREKRSPAAFFSFRTIAEYVDAKRSLLHTCDSGKPGSGVNINDIEKPKDSTFSFQALIINEYKSFFRENVNTQLQKSFFEDFFFKIESNEVVSGLYDLTGFSDELNGLEEDYFNLVDHKLILPYYRSFLKRLDLYITTKKSDGNKTQHKVLYYLRVAAMSTISSVVNYFDSYTVIHIKEYFKLVEKHIDKYKLALNEVKIDTYKNQYHQYITQQISEANNLIENEVIPAIDGIYEQIDDNIDSVLQDIFDDIKSKKSETQELLKKQNKMEEEYITRRSLNFLKFASNFLTFAGPEGAVAAGIIGEGADAIGNKLFDDDEIPLIQTAVKSIGHVTEYFIQQRRNMKEHLELAETEISQKITEEDKKNAVKVLDVVKPLKVISGETSATHKDYLQVKKHTKENLKLYLKELNNKEELLLKISSKKSRTRRKSDDDDESTKSQFEWATLFDNVINLAEAGNDLRKFVKNREEINEVENSIETVCDEIKELEDFEVSIYDTIIPMRRNFEEELHSHYTFTNESHASLDVSKWKIQNTIRDFQVQIQNMLLDAAESRKNLLMASTDKLHHGMLTIIKVYDRIQDYYDKMKLANYIADLGSDSTYTIEEKKYIDKLELLTKSHLVIQEINKATDAFKQFIFPFANLYLDQFELQQQVISKDIDQVVFKASMLLNFLSDQLTKDESVIKEKAYRIFPEVKFDSSKVEEPPFFVWKHAAYKKEISKLLQGKEIELKANIRGGLNQNAIKFSEIGVNFRLKDNTIQKDFDKLMADYLVVMRHAGDSYYRCDSKYYVIDHNSLSMKHSVDKGNGEKYYHLDETSTIIKNNPAIFSPYTTWRIQLGVKDDEADKGFSVLKKYVGEEMDLALEGWGRYVELGLDVCNDHLLMHYKDVDIDIG